MAPNSDTQHGQEASSPHTDIRGWPAAAISDERARLAFQRARGDLKVAGTTPSVLVDKDDNIVAQVFERKAEGLDEKDQTAEMWARARLLAQAPKMYEALRIIANQAIGPEYTAEEVLQFIKQHAREVMTEARGAKAQSAAG